ncbi:unnamed protein product [Peronospora belbahrii]|uniref:Uncharacterized protein n=1 Tax=Peronospora belbahrii TaxID=622444 RepID=A0ABN8CL28_9STRA|nr:unnamed protein product [Peronospora belbahrii]
MLSDSGLLGLSADKIQRTRFDRRFCFDNEADADIILAQFAPTTDIRLCTFAIEFQSDLVALGYSTMTTISAPPTSGLDSAIADRYLECSDHKLVKAVVLCFQ